ncbi:MAG: PIN domain-containing protein [Proteobacteria bacterium]|nr:PIN domain-containing protein [Pseudomonadota bacterium]
MIVLDSSALLAIALEEPGAERVRSVLSQSFMAAANLAEVLTVGHRKGVDAEHLFAGLLGFGVSFVDTTAVHARVAAQIWRAHPRLNLSLGDRLCLALAIDLHSGVLTSDREMAKPSLGIDVEMFR